MAASSIGCAGATSAIMYRAATFSREAECQWHGRFMGDGKEFHGSRERVANDRAKDKLAVETGVRIFRFFRFRYTPRS